jgi:ABC-2 type transport system ATP-binding protein
VTEDERPVLEAVGLAKRYGARRALDRVDLALRAGEVVGLLGPNGAGKSTALAILSTTLAPDAGRVTIDGRSPHEDRTVRRRVGLVPQSLAVYPSLTARENVGHFARMLGLDRGAARAAAARALDAVGLAERADDRVRTLSGGMQRRCNLACGFVHGPAVLLLDEPTVGVDIESREAILALVRRLRDAGTAVLYSTHYMEEAERICDRVLLIDGGTVVADGTVDALVARAGARPRLRLTGRGFPSSDWWAPLAGVRELPDARGEGVVVLELPHLALVGAVLDRVRAAGTHVVDVTVHAPNLADAFVALTGRRLLDDAAA